MTDLTPILRSAADYIDAHGWTQGEREAADGSVCLTGAIRYCQPQGGDWLLVRAVLRHQGRAEVWNDNWKRTRDEVVGYLRSAVITDADLADTFGPPWAEVVALVRRAAVLTPGEAMRLDAARAAARAAAWDAGAAAWDAAGAAAGAAAWDAAWDAAARGAARDAALATVTRDLIGTSGYTQAHHDLLMGPWLSVVGAA